MGETGPLTTAADMWSVGVMLTELLLNKGLRTRYLDWYKGWRDAGKNREDFKKKDTFFIRPTKDQLKKIPGWLSSSPWEGPEELQALADAPEAAKHIITGLLQVDPVERIERGFGSAADALPQLAHWFEAEGAPEPDAQHTGNPDPNVFHRIDEIKERTDIFNPENLEFSALGYQAQKDLLEALREEAIHEIADIRKLLVRRRRLGSLERLIKETTRACNWTPSDGDTKPEPHSKAETTAHRRLTSLRSHDRTYKTRTTENEY